MKEELDAQNWSVKDVGLWLENSGFRKHKVSFATQKIDGVTLLLLTEKDIKEDLGVTLLGELKKLHLAICQLQVKCGNPYRIEIPTYGSLAHHSPYCLRSPCNNNSSFSTSSNHVRKHSDDSDLDFTEEEGSSSPKFNVSSDLRPEYSKTIVSCLYMFLVTWITAIVMVYVHDRVPDKERHPPLPDIFLDNVPHISWAFQLCEVTILVMSITWVIILFFHKHRSIAVRRCAALSGSVFLLRCATMFITSLSVPGIHLDCKPREPSELGTKIYQAWIIWRGGGLSIKGVRTCGDYMFSGHTTALTMLNFFITEYTPRRLYFLHIASWVLNTFGIFFILAAHEHYSIDVFIAFYITSRMFLYYHSLANNRALHQRDAFRTRIWFPMFSYFESNISGHIPNEYSNPLKMKNLKWFLQKINGKFWGSYVESWQRKSCSKWK